MTVHRRFVVLVSCAAFMLLPAAANAQSKAELPVTLGQKVRIDLRDGRTVSGKVSGVSQQEILVSGPDPMRTRIAVADIRRVRERDSLGDGAGKGAVILGLLGALAGIGADGLSDAFGNSSNGSYFLAGAGIGLASGAAIGAGLDALRLKTIYERQNSDMSVDLRPILSNARKGVGVQVRW